MNKLVSIVNPAQNEEDNIIGIISRIEKVFTNLSYNYELIFDDDDSHDKTLIKLKEQAHIKSNDFL
jgi:glycosyltransferase involved in cell wall biosynthesis